MGKKLENLLFAASLTGTLLGTGVGYYGTLNNMTMTPISDNPQLVRYYDTKKEMIELERFTIQEMLRKGMNVQDVISRYNFLKQQAKELESQKEVNLSIYQTERYNKTLAWGGVSYSIASILFLGIPAIVLMRRRERDKFEKRHGQRRLPLKLSY